MCVLAERARVPQIYIKVLLPVLPLESSRFFFPLPDLKNKQVQKLFKSVGKGILAGCRFHFILVKGGHDGCYFNILLLKLSDILKLNRFYRKHTYPLPRSNSYCFTILVISHICPAIYTSVCQFRLFFLNAFQMLSSAFRVIWP